MEMNAQAMQQVQANQVALLEKVQEGKEHNEMRALSAMILQDPSSIREAAAMQHGGTQVADMLMKEGQKASALILQTSAEPLIFLTVGPSF